MGISLRSRSLLLAASGLTFEKTCSVSHTHAKEGPLLPGLPLEARSFCGKVIPGSPPRPIPPFPPPSFSDLASFQSKKQSFLLSPE